MGQSKIKGASILVTGANGGMGLETIKLLIERGAKRIVLACRTQAKADWAREQLSSPNAPKTELISAGGFDMLKPESIQNAVDQLEFVEPFDIVFLQSGGMVVSDDYQFVTASDKRVEKTIFQNTIGGFLTQVFLDERGLVDEHTRVVYAGGEGARGIPGAIEKPSYRSVDSFQSYVRNGDGTYKAFNAIGVSKFCSALLVQKLAALHPNREYVWFSPGLTGGTKGLDAVPNPKRFIMKNIAFPMLQLLGVAQGPRQAAVKYADCLDGRYGTNGDLIGAPEGKALGKLVDQKPMNPCLTSHRMQDAFYEIADGVRKSYLKSEPLLTA